MFRKKDAKKKEKPKPKPTEEEEETEGESESTKVRTIQIGPNCLRFKLIKPTAFTFGSY